jgi:hypothetical protein
VVSGLRPPPPQQQQQLGAGGRGAVGWRGCDIASHNPLSSLVAEERILHKAGDVAVQLGSGDVAVQLGAGDVAVQLGAGDVAVQLGAGDVAVQLGAGSNGTWAQAVVRRALVT